MRLYDPVVMRFTTIDPLAEKYYPTSPYAYCQNDPLTKVDPTGMDWREAKMHFGKSCDIRISFGFQAGLSLKAGVWNYQWGPVGSKHHTSQGDMQITEGQILDKLGIDGSLLIGISLTINIDEVIQAFKSLFE